MTDNAPVIMWFREDLRLKDNPALRAAVNTGQPVICLFILDEETDGLSYGGALKWWLHHSLTSLGEDIRQAGASLTLRRGQTDTILKDIVAKAGASAVYWNRRYGPAQIAQDKQVKSDLKDREIDVHSFNGRLIFEPWEIETKTGGHYKVFTPFWKAMQKEAPIRDEGTGLRKIDGPEYLPASDALDDWALLPTNPDWSTGFDPVWTPGENGAHTRLRAFLKDGARRYDDERNRPDLDTTSRLSPHLQFGEISPVQIWHTVRNAQNAGDIPDSHAHTFLSEIAWREFSYVQLFHNPQMTDNELMEKFRDFPWENDPVKLRAWQQGRTGYPIVDAGMRQLWQTGWMHNRVRMIVGSFLVKHLLIDWREGMRWFEDCLVDADIGSNTASWQWVAGCGADAAPYFRIFNPITQGQKFDPKGDFTRKYVPELEKMPTKHLFAPWDAPDNVLQAAGVDLGKTYPAPIVSHPEARQRALDAYEKIK